MRRIAAVLRWLHKAMIMAEYLECGIDIGREAKAAERKRIRRELDNHFAGRLKSEIMTVGRVQEYIEQALKEVD